MTEVHEEQTTDELPEMLPGASMSIWYNPGDNTTATMMTVDRQQRRLLIREGVDASRLVPTEEMADELQGYHQIFPTTMTPEELAKDLFPEIEHTDILRFLLTSKLSSETVTRLLEFMREMAQVRARDATKLSLMAARYHMSTAALETRFRDEVEKARKQVAEANQRIDTIQSSLPLDAKKAVQRLEQETLYSADYVRAVFSRYYGSEIVERVMAQHTPPDLYSVADPKVHFRLQDVFYFAPAAKQLMYRPSPAGDWKPLLTYSEVWHAVRFYAERQPYTSKRIAETEDHPGGTLCYTHPRDPNRHTHVESEMRAWEREVGL